MNTTLKGWLDTDGSVKGIGDETASLRLEMDVLMLFRGGLVTSGKQNLWLKDDSIHHDPAP